MVKIMVSQCLLGCCCRYKGDHCLNESILQLSLNHTLIPVCPEQMGGLPTPRDPSEIMNGRLISNKGKDVTFEYQKGAEIALMIAKMNKVDFAIFKTKSPSCGKGMIYDGTFSGTLVSGNGVTVDLFLNNGIDVYSEEEIAQIEKRLTKNG